MRYLITGGAGFIGSSLADKLIQDRNNYVVLVDDLSTGLQGNLPNAGDNWRFVKCDVNNYGDISGIMLATKFDFVFHYAAVVGVQRTLANPVKVLSPSSQSGIDGSVGLTAVNVTVATRLPSSGTED